MNGSHSIDGGERDNLDRLLDRALTSYTPAEPRVGFEARIHARLAAADDAPQLRARFRWPWVLAAAAALGAIFLAAGVLHFHAQPKPENQAAVKKESTPAALAPIPTSAASTEYPAPKSPRHTAPMPHRSEPQPTQQQLIAMLLANGPEAIASLARGVDQSDKPIAIKPIPSDPLVIEPLEIKPIDDNPAAPGDRP